MSPIDDTFLSAAKNEAVRFWDLRTPQCQVCLSLSLDVTRAVLTLSSPQAMLPVQGHPVIAYDASGRVFAIALNERPSVSLYDVRNFTAVSESAPGYIAERTLNGADNRDRSW